MNFIEGPPETDNECQLNVDKPRPHAPLPSSLEKVPQLVRRDWIKKRNSNNYKINSNRSFKVMHWKILSNKEAMNNTDVPKEYLDWEYRWSMI